MKDSDMVIHMPPVKEYTVRMKIKSVEEGRPSRYEPELPDAEIPESLGDEEE